MIKSLLFNEIIGVVVFYIGLVYALVEVTSFGNSRLNGIIHHIVNFLHLFDYFLFFHLLRRQKEANYL